jgi:hypothetical protein
MAARLDERPRLAEMAIGANPRLGDIGRPRDPGDQQEQAGDERADIRMDGKV